MKPPQLINKRTVHTLFRAISTVLGMLGLKWLYGFCLLWFEDESIISHEYD